APGNFPQKGYLRVEYYSGADKGCSPVWASRRATAQNVLADVPAHFDAFLAHREALRRLARPSANAAQHPLDPLIGAVDDDPPERSPTSASSP
ncbi:hypothetical protein DYB32_010348, partial [Aphanomyces invadans]